MKLASSSKVEGFRLMLISFQSGKKLAISLHFVQIEMSTNPGFSANECYFQIHHQFALIPQELSVSEDTPPGTVVGQVMASDRDEGANGLVTYLLVGGNSFGYFGLNATTGHIYVVRPLDHEMNDTHVLTIRAIDSSGINPKSTLVRMTITVTDVNDCPPVFKEDPVS